VFSNGLRGNNNSVATFSARDRWAEQYHHFSKSIKSVAVVLARRLIGKVPLPLNNPSARPRATEPVFTLHKEQRARRSRKAWHSIGNSRFSSLIFVTRAVGIITHVIRRRVTLGVNYQVMASPFREVTLNVLRDGSAVVCSCVLLAGSVSVAFRLRVGVGKIWRATERLAREQKGEPHRGGAPGRRSDDGRTTATGAFGHTALGQSHCPRHVTKRTTGRHS
jgi:hypothetical protein